MVSVVFQPPVKLDLISEIKNTNFVVMSTVKRTWSIEGKKMGAKILHLGGCSGGSFDDDLFRFKTGFGTTL